MYPHRIRLRGPWEYEPLARLSPTTEPLPSAGRMTLPCRWDEGGLKDFAGRVRFVRRFGQPRQIDPHEHVWLTFGGVDGTADIWLNGQSLGRHEDTAGPFEFEATELLRVRNELRVEVEAGHVRGGLWGEVALEVRCAAFLRGVRAWIVRDAAADSLHISGEIIGPPEPPLELYVLWHNRTVHYGTLAASPIGAPIEVVVKVPPPDWPSAVGGAPLFSPVRVELVNGAVIWYAVEPAVE
jgi:hypothetical protein